MNESFLRVRQGGTVGATARSLSISARGAREYEGMGAAAIGLADGVVAAAALRARLLHAGITIAGRRALNLPGWPAVAQKQRRAAAAANQRDGEQGGPGREQRSAVAEQQRTNANHGPPRWAYYGFSDTRLCHAAGPLGRMARVMSHRWSHCLRRAAAVRKKSARHGPRAWPLAGPLASGIQRITQKRCRSPSVAATWFGVDEGGSVLIAATFDAAVPSGFSPSEPLACW